MISKDGIREAARAIGAAHDELAATGSKRDAASLLRGMLLHCVSGNCPRWWSLAAPVPSHAAAIREAQVCGDAEFCADADLLAASQAAARSKILPISCGERANDPTGTGVAGAQAGAPSVKLLPCQRWASITPPEGPDGATSMTQPSDELLVRPRPLPSACLQDACLLPGWTIFRNVAAVMQAACKVHPTISKIASFDAADGKAVWKLWSSMTVR